MFLGSGRNEMTRGSLFPRTEIDLHTVIDLGRHWDDIVFLSAKKGPYDAFRQVYFLDILTGKETFLLYGGKKREEVAIQLWDILGTKIGPKTFPCQGQTAFYRG